jgi:hypothetical protein
MVQHLKERWKTLSRNKKQKNKIKYNEIKNIKKEKENSVQVLKKSKAIPVTGRGGLKGL